MCAACTTNSRLARVRTAGSAHSARTERLSYAAAIAKKAHHDGSSLLEACLALGLIDEATFRRLVRPEAMV